jgi:hypothetical protein
VPEPILRVHIWLKGYARATENCASWLHCFAQCAISCKEELQALRFLRKAASPK